MLATVVMLLGVAGSPAQAATGRPFVNHAGGKCLEIADWRTDNGAPARQWIYGGSRQANMEWSHCSNRPGCMTD